MVIAYEFGPILPTVEASIALAMHIVAVLDDSIASKTDLLHDGFLRYLLNPGHIAAQTKKTRKDFYVALKIEP